MTSRFLDGEVGQHGNVGFEATRLDSCRSFEHLLPIPILYIILYII